MSDYYKPHRHPDWNYGGPKFRLSRSKLELFVECPRCFYLDNKLGTARPRGPAFTLNVAVDALLKKEFDTHRAKGEPHPLMRRYEIDAIPYDHEMMDIWRENFKGIDYKHEATGFVVSGAVDDVWVNPKGELIVVDYKATSKDGEIETLADSAWEQQYRRQMGIYQWLLKQNGFKVNSTGYFVYCNAGSDKEAFDGQLEFKVTIVPCEGTTEWVEPALMDAKKCLDGSTIPPAGPKCDFCTYRDAAGKAFRSVIEESLKNKKDETKSKKLKIKAEEGESVKTAGLF
jgi:hypothetical protein